MKRAIVIGASSGIGKEVAQNLINEGWTVGLAARRDGLMLSMMHATPDRVKVAKIDVNASNAADELNKLIKRIGGMDLFFYAAGIGKQNRELVEEPELATVRTNALGFTRMIGVAYRYFAEKGEGHIAAITSIAGTKGLGPAPAYSATKAMQKMMIRRTGPSESELRSWIPEARQESAMIRCPYPFYYFRILPLFHPQPSSARHGVR